MPPRSTSQVLSTLSRASRRNTCTPLHFLNRTMASGTPSDTAKAQAAAEADAPSLSSLGIQHTDIKTAAGVTLSGQQKVVVGSVLDLFAGNPTLKHFSLWAQDATFADPLTVATGYPKYTAQFYGLPALFKPIQIQRHQVTSAGNPIEVELRNKYVVKGINKEQTVDSVVKIHLGADGKIDRLEDRWDGDLPDGAVSNVSALSLINPVAWARWAVRTGSQAAWRAFCTCSWWLPFLAFRKLNAVTVPAIVKVPKNEEEDMKMKEEREKS